MFIDEVDIQVQSGKGGDGIVHFRREKYINRGGPDGGDGGRGGDIYLKANIHLNTLEKFRHQTRFNAEDGKRGGVNNQTGQSGKDLMIDVPTGTEVYNAESKLKIADLVEDGQVFLVCEGGRGGRGNARFANARIQAPRLAEKGEPFREKELHLELKLIADIGIIGMPNAGKSSFISATTHANPKIADYPFTTLVPNLGVAVLDNDHTLVLADIPGLIEGSHQGHGLGHTFLRHVQRTRVLIHMIDGTSEDPLADYLQVNIEISLFDPALSKKPQVVVINKIDLPEVVNREKKIRSVFKKIGVDVILISALAKINLEKVLWKCFQHLESIEDQEVLFDSRLPIYQPESDQMSFQILKSNKGWIVKGAAIERAAAMTYWDYFSSVRRFHRIIEAMGISDALEKKGIKEGDTVIIGTHELTWTLEWEKNEKG